MQKEIKKAIERELNYIAGYNYSQKDLDEIVFKFEGVELLSKLLEFENKLSTLESKHDNEMFLKKNSWLSKIS